MSGQRPQDWSAEDKLAVVAEAGQLSDDELGAFLRQRGLHQAQLEQWRRQVLAGLEQGGGKARKSTSAAARRVRELERELDRKDKALAETAALLALKKRAEAIWGDADDGTTSKSGKKSCG